jgi:hypothetical protein
MPGCMAKRRQIRSFLWFLTIAPQTTGLLARAKHWCSGGARVGSGVACPGRCDWRGWCWWGGMVPPDKETIIMTNMTAKAAQGSKAKPATKATDKAKAMAAHPSPTVQAARND